MTTTRIGAPACVRCMGQGPIDCPGCHGSGRRDVANLRAPMPTTRHLMAPLAKCEPSRYPPPLADGVRVLDRGHEIVLECARGGRIVEMPITRAELARLIIEAGRVLAEEGTP